MPPRLLTDTELASMTVAYMELLYPNETQANRLTMAEAWAMELREANGVGIRYLTGVIPPGYTPWVNVRAAEQTSFPRLLELALELEDACNESLSWNATPVRFTLEIMRDQFAANAALRGSMV